ncbi:MAG: hypothetical protein JOZ87_10565, partial [Chloroflexi bacterium]|nr:hypothetical protein [Chloroflexota bacterium]
MRERDDIAGARQVEPVRLAARRLEAGFVAPADLDLPAGNLPRELASFIGRERE